MWCVCVVWRCQSLAYREARGGCQCLALELRWQSATHPLPVQVSQAVPVVPVLCPPSLPCLSSAGVTNCHGHAQLCLGSRIQTQDLCVFSTWAAVSPGLVWFLHRHQQGMRSYSSKCLLNSIEVILSVPVLIKPLIWFLVLSSVCLILSIN